MTAVGLPFLIPTVRARAQRYWQIRLPDMDRQAELILMQDFAAYERWLVGLGFERVTSVASTLYESRNDHLQTHSLWHHDAGLLARLHSMTELRGGQSRQRLGTMIVHAQLDCGMGAQYLRQATQRLSWRGSNSVLTCLDGRDIHAISFILSDSGVAGLVEHLRTCQEIGRFVRVRDWLPDTGSPIHFPDEMLVPVTTRHTRRPTIAQRAKGRAAFIDRLPPDIAALLRHRPRDAENVDGLREQAAVQDLLEHFSEAMFLAGRRWPTAAERGLLNHWAQVALGRHGDRMQDWRAHEDGPAGLSLPVALLHVRAPDGGLGNGFHAGQALVRVLESAPRATLTRWACEADAAGYTLGLHAVERLFTHAADEADPLETVEHTLRILHSRLGERGLPMATACRSVLGVVLQQRVRTARVPGTTLAANAHRLGVVLDLLDGWRLPWNRHLFWGAGASQAAGPTFHCIDGDVDTHVWRQAAQSLALDLEPDSALIARLCRAELRTAVAADPPARRSRRRRGL